MDLGGGSEAVHGDQHSLVSEQLPERRCLGFVQLQAPGDRLRRVVGPAPLQHPLGHHLVGHIQVDRPVHRVRRQQREQAVGLGLSAREAVEQETRSGIRFGEPLSDDAQDQLVADQVASVHHCLGLPAQLGARSDGGAQHVACRDVGDAVALHQQLALGALASSLLAQDDQPSRAHQARNPS